jgi:hypothetical protein
MHGPGGGGGSGALFTTEGFIGLRLTSLRLAGLECFFNAAFQIFISHRVFGSWIGLASDREENLRSSTR